MLHSRNKVGFSFFLLSEYKNGPTDACVVSPFESPGMTAMLVPSTAVMSHTSGEGTESDWYATFDMKKHHFALKNSEAPLDQGVQLLRLFRYRSDIVNCFSLVRLHTDI